MVQELQVLKCVSCCTFQVQIVKKTKKWDCKICHQKQSTKEVFGRGSGKDCRLHVQKLNALRVEQDGCNVTDDQFSTFWSSAEQVSTYHQRDSGQPTKDQGSCVSGQVGSKWDKYLDKDNEEEEEEDNRHLLGAQNFQVRKKRKLNHEYTSRESPHRGHENPGSNTSNVSPRLGSLHSIGVGGKYSHQNRNFLTAAYQNPMNFNKPSSREKVTDSSKEKAHTKNNFSQGNGLLNSGFKANKNVTGISKTITSHMSNHKPSVSKWNKYVDNDDNSNEYSNDSSVHLFNPKQKDSNNSKSFTKSNSTLKENQLERNTYVDNDNQDENSNDGDINIIKRKENNSIISRCESFKNASLNKKPSFSKWNKYVNSEQNDDGTEEGITYFQSYNTEPMSDNISTDLSKSEKSFQNFNNEISSLETSEGTNLDFDLNTEPERHSSENIKNFKTNDVLSNLLDASEDVITEPERHSSENIKNFKTNDVLSNLLDASEDVITEPERHSSENIKNNKKFKTNDVLSSLLDASEDVITEPERHSSENNKKFKTNDVLSSLLDASEDVITEPERHSSENNKNNKKFKTNDVLSSLLDASEDVITEPERHSSENNKKFKTNDVLSSLLDASEDVITEPERHSSENIKNNKKFKTNDVLSSLSYASEDVITEPERHSSENNKKFKTNDVLSSLSDASEDEDGLNYFSAKQSDSIQNSNTLASLMTAGLESDALRNTGLSKTQKSNNLLLNLLDVSDNQDSSQHSKQSGSIQKPNISTSHNVPSLKLKAPNIGGGSKTAQNSKPLTFQSTARSKSAVPNNVQDRKLCLFEADDDFLDQILDDF